MECFPLGGGCAVYYIYHHQSTKCSKLRIFAKLFIDICGFSSEFSLSPSRSLLSLQARQRLTRLQTCIVPHPRVCHPQRPRPPPPPYLPEWPDRWPLREGHHTHKHPARPPQWPPGSSIRDRMREIKIFKWGFSQRKQKRGDFHSQTCVLCCHTHTFTHTHTLILNAQQHFCVIMA